MPNILFASNNLAHFPLSVSSATAGKFDSTRVPYAFLLEKDQSMASPEFTPASGDVTWIHFRMIFDNLNDPDSPTLLTVFDGNQNMIMRLRKPGFNSEYIVTPTLFTDAVGGFTSGTFGFPFNRGAMNSIDIKFTATAGSLQMKTYVNGGLTSTIDHGSNTASLGQPTHFVIGCCFANGNSDACFMSEILVADGDTRNGRVNLLRPTATGGESDWIGLAAELADDDPSSGMTSIAANERHTFVLSTYTGAANVSSVLVTTLSLAGANAPQNMRHLVRFAGMNYESVADLPLGDTLQYTVTDYQINPSTSVPWIGGDMANLEMGFISKT